ncbi:hypothetical protein QYZ87_04870 [Porphyromonadaceae bacterium W3.11]|nr:hypothetical protein [Porphyromonadaceae bacterium W3.11]
MERRILVTPEGRDFLMRSFAVSEQMISYALNYKRHSDLAQKIRSLALQRGGKLVTEEMVTIYESNGDMIQTWGNRARLVANMKSGDVMVYIDGQLDRQFKNMSIAELMKEQNRISLLLGSRG